MRNWENAFNFTFQKLKEKPGEVNINTQSKKKLEKAVSSWLGSSGVDSQATLNNLNKVPIENKNDLKTLVNSFVVDSSESPSVILPSSVTPSSVSPQKEVTEKEFISDQEKNGGKTNDFTEIPNIDPLEKKIEIPIVDSSTPKNTTAPISFLIEDNHDEDDDDDDSDDDEDVEEDEEEEEENFENKIKEEKTKIDN